MIKPLTLKQQTAWNEREKGLTFLEISEIMGVRPQQVWKYHHDAKKKMEAKAAEERRQRLMPGPHAIENKHPEAAAKIIDKVLSPEQYRKIDDLAAEVGLHKSTVDALKKRLEFRYLPVGIELGRIRTEQFAEGIDGYANWILNSVDECDLLKASLKDKISAFCMLIDRRQLLSGEPTQILSINERKDINDLMPLLVAEATRRGLTIDVDPITGEQLGP